jgi:hypothetical protein
MGILPPFARGCGPLSPGAQTLPQRQAAAGFPQRNGRPPCPASACQQWVLSRFLPLPEGRKECRSGEHPSHAPPAKPVGPGGPRFNWQPIPISEASQKRPGYRSFAEASWLATLRRSVLVSDASQKRPDRLKTVAASRIRPTPLCRLFQTVAGICSPGAWLQNNPRQVLRSCTMAG